MGWGMLKCLPKGWKFREINKYTLDYSPESRRKERRRGQQVACHTDLQCHQVIHFTGHLRACQHAIQHCASSAVPRVTELICAAAHLCGTHTASFHAGNVPHAEPLSTDLGAQTQDDTACDIFPPPGANPATSHSFCTLQTPGEGKLIR